CEWKDVHRRYQPDSKFGALDSSGRSHVRQSAEGQWSSGCHIHVGRQCRLSIAHSQVSLNRVAVLPPAPPNRTTRFRAASNTIATSERADGPTSCFCVHKSCDMEQSLSLPTSPPKLFLVIRTSRHAVKRVATA